MSHAEWAASLRQPENEIVEIFFEESEDAPQVVAVDLPELAEPSWWQRRFDRLKRAIGGAVLAAGLATTPAVVLEPAAHATVVTVAPNENNYPNNDAVCVASGPNQGKASGSGYWCKDYSWGYFTRDSQGNITGNSQISSRGYGYRNCTDWAAFRTRELTGKAIPTSLGNANTWDNNAPSSWSKTGTPEPGDIAQTDAGTSGHVGVVEEVRKDASGKMSSIVVSEYNAGQDGNYSEETDTADANGNFWRPNGAKWATFLDVNGIGVGVDGATSSNSGSDNTVLKVEKRNQSDGVNLVYWAKAGSVFESWWRPGGDGVHIHDLVDISQQDIKDIDAQLNSDGEHLLYTATSHYVWETYWYAGQGTHTAAIIQDAGNIRKIEKTVGPDGAEQLYVMTDQGVDEYWWRPGGDIHKNRIYTLANPVAMQKVLEPDGTQELYVADHAYVYRNWWDTDQINAGEQIMHIAQADITSLAFSEDTDGQRHLDVGRQRDGVWEAAWYPGQALRTWQITGGDGVVDIARQHDGDTQQLYVATSGGVFEYWWPTASTETHGNAITAQADIRDIDRSTTTDGAQAIYTAANTRVYESYWFPGGDGVHTKPIA